MIRKYLMILFGLILVAVFSILFLVKEDQKKEIDLLTKQAENILLIESEKITFHLNDVITDIRYLSNKFPTHVRDEIKKDFLNFSKNKKRYDQIRFLDLNGMEKIRVNFKGKNTYLVPDHLLQNKKSRYYFKNAIDLKKDQIYISPLDLNMENGQIEVPIKPMIRFVTPVFDAKGKKKGVIIINYLADQILFRLKNIRDSFSGDINLLNSKGYYYISKDSSDEWGFMFPHKQEVTFEKRHPAIWSEIITNNYGKISSNKGLYFYKSVKIDDAFNNPSHLACNSCVWRIVLFVPKDHLDLKMISDIKRYIPFAIISLAITAVILWLLLGEYRRKVKSQEMIDELHKEILNERDLFVTGPTVIFKLKNAYGWPVEYVSDNIKSVLGYEKGEFIEGDLNYANIISPEDIDRYSRGVAEAKKENLKSFEHEPYRVVTKEGKHVWLSDSVLVIRDEKGNVTHLYGYVIDVTALKDAQKEVEDKSRFVKTVIDTIADPTVVIDVKTYDVVLFNKAAKEMYIRGERIPSGLKCYGLSHAQDTPCCGDDHPCPIEQILKSGKKTRVTHRHFKSDGSPIDVELVAIPILDQKGEIVQIIESHHDISHHLKTEESLKKLASTDRLTQTYNRTMFDEILENSFKEAIENFEYFGLIMFDIDHFKSVNDTFGHDVGDSVLIEITNLIKNNIREHDLLVRWGGEEFIIYIPDADNEKLKHISEHLRKKVEEYDFKYVGKKTASFGTTLLRNDDTIESLIKRVDSALYNSKENGRNMVTLI